MLMKKSIIFSIVFLLFSFIFLFSIYAAEEKREGLTFIKEFEGGKLYQSGIFDVVILKGTYRQMGRQYGGLVKDKIISFYEENVVKTIIDGKLMTLEQLNEMSVKPYLNSCAKRQKEMLTGMSETTGLSIDKAVLASAGPGAVLLVRMMQTVNTGSCTSLAAWGPYTADGTVYTIRDFDFPFYYRDFVKKYATILVLKPTDGSNFTAGVCLSGMFMFLDAMNEKGLYVESNNGAYSDGLKTYINRASIDGEQLNALFDSDNLAQFQNRMNTINANYPIIILTASPIEAFYIEKATEGQKIRRAENEGLIAAANQFMDPSWGLALLPSPAAWFSQTRHDNFIALAENYKGKIDEKIMMNILDVPLYNDDGSIGKGAAVIEKNPKDSEITVWQVITKPSELKVWVRIPEYTGWLNFNLKELFEL